MTNVPQSPWTKTRTILPERTKKFEYLAHKTVEDKNKKLEEGKNVDYIIVTFLNGTATGAEFGTLEGNKQ